ncbi:MAG: hypothetical protein JWO19_4393 [Bryobacterales bacterium]|nr:hypothetical protein [Bryobacterales bacterium]
MNTNGCEFEFEPALEMPNGSGCEVHIQMPSGHAHVEIRCLITHQLIEHRHDCQVIEVGEKRVIVAAPGSIERPKLSWKVRLLRWLAKG